LCIDKAARRRYTHGIGLVRSSGAGLDQPARSCRAVFEAMELDLRKQALLQAIVDTYVRSAEPVGSEWLAAHQNLGVRSATIRNEMAELTELGLLRQPHTSAGRVPSDRGYRYYVDRLMHRRPLPAPHARPLREVGRVADGDVEDLLRQTCRVLSSLTRYTSVASPPVTEHPRIRQVHLAKMSERQLLLVVVLDNGCLIHRFAEPPQPLSPAEVERLSSGLDQLLGGAEADAVAGRIARLPGELSGYRETLVSLLGVIERSLNEEEGDMYLEGASRMLEQPEFRDAGKVEPLIRLLEARKVAFEMLQELLSDEPLTVVIGTENPQQVFQECSLVAARYGAGRSAAGWIGVVGPTRMLYGHAVPAVKMAARSLTEAFARIGLD
jgi:heat-inducible transcriptional repressor